MKKLAQLFLLGVIMTSCVNEAYDLNKIDGTVALMKDYSLPIGSLEKMTIGDLLSLSSDASSMLTTNSDGDIIFQLTGGKPISERIEIPTVSIPFNDELSSDDYSISINTGALAGMSGTAINQIVYLRNQRLEKVLSIDDTYLLPSEIVDIKHVEVNMLIDYSFKVSSGAANISTGFTVDFPDWLTLIKTDNRQDYIIETQGSNKNVVRFTKDVKVTKSTPIVLSLKVSKIEFTAGTLVNGGNDSQGKPCKKVYLNPQDAANKVVVAGDIFIDTNDFPTIPETLDMNMQLDFSNFNVTAANLCLDISYQFDGQSLKVTDYPELFNSEDITLDIYDAFLRFDISNPLPVQLEVNADIEAYKNSVLSNSIHLGAGATNGTSPIVIPANTTNSSFLFSMLGTQESIKVPQIGSLISALPDMIKISDISIKGNQDYININLGSTYDCSIAYDLHTPLAFGKDFKFKYDMDIDEIGLDLSETGIAEATLVLTTTNSIPLNFNLEAKALDSNGQPVDGMSIDIVGDIAAGTHNKPVTSPVEIRLTSQSKSIHLNSLKLTLSATGASGENIGVPLNEAQGLKLDNISLRLPEGVVMDVNNILN